MAYEGEAQFICLGMPGLYINSGVDLLLLIRKSF
jgi:hypothetical protein